MGVDVFDPWVDENEATTLYDLSLTRELKNDTYSAIILAVAHSESKDFGVAGITKLCKSSHVIYDLKSILPASDSTNILRL